MRRMWLAAILLLGLGCGGSGPPSSYLKGPWVFYDTGGTFVMSVIFDGVDAWNPAMFNSEQGTYTVGEDGTVALNHPTLPGFPLVGTLNAGKTRVDLSGGAGYVEKAADPGALAGTWTGTLLESVGVSYPVTLTVDSWGNITSLTGFANFVRGFAYEGDFQGQAGVCVFYWHCDIATVYNEVFVIGTLSGETLLALYAVDNGDYDPDGLGATLTRLP